MSYVKGTSLDPLQQMNIRSGQRWLQAASQRYGTPFGQSDAEAAVVAAAAEAAKKNGNGAAAAPAAEKPTGTGPSKKLLVFAGLALGAYLLWGRDKPKRKNPGRRGRPPGVPGPRPTRPNPRRRRRRRRRR